MAIIAEMHVNGEPVRVLLDFGSLGDFISTTSGDQLKIKTKTLLKPLGLMMAVVGLCGAIMYSATVNIKYQEIDGMYRLDVANLDCYDSILGTTFMHRHSMVPLFNLHAVLICLIKPLPLTGPLVKMISLCAAALHEAELDKLPDMLRQKSEDICKGAAETPLLPLCIINHRIPLINENTVYAYRTSRCPEVLREQWEKKLKVYIKTGCWEHATGKNAVPMWLIPKKETEGVSTLRTVLDKHEQNANTEKLVSPLPDIQEILWDISKYQYKSLIDGRDAYEQICVEPNDVHKTLFTTPSGTLLRYMMQQGDCNAGTSYQALMNSLFAHCIGKSMHVFLDDLVIFTNLVEEHIQ